jgi:membrane-bound inhibitor of C-type lysozyme
VSVAFLDAEPDLVYFEWMENFVVLPAVASGSGTKYSGQFRGQNYSFWTKGSEGCSSDPGRPKRNAGSKRL